MGLDKTLNQLREKNLLINDLNRISCTKRVRVLKFSVGKFFNLAARLLLEQNV